MGFGTFIFVSILAHLKIPLDSLNIDRWSVIDTFLNSFFNNESHPYKALSHKGNPPGPMPFYYFLNVPFYFTKWYVIPPLLSVFILSVITVRTSISDRLKTILLICVFSSILLFYEIATRSNILINSLIIAFILNHLLKLNYDRLESRNVFAYILFGLLMSTRAVFIIPTIIFFLYLLRKKQKSTLITLNFIAVAAFSFTFTPLLFKYDNPLDAFTPFLIQSSELIPVHYIAITIILVTLISPKINSLMKLNFFAGLAMFLLILTYSIRLIIIHGFDVAFFGNKVDLTYFIFSVPFLYYYLLSAFHKEKIETP